MNSKLPQISDNFAEWYQEVVYQSELVDNAPVRGCMVIRPYGTALWENITKILDQKLKDTGHHNAVFPLFIPQSFLQKEAEHVQGFAPELAIVTHAGGEELKEPLVVRPTSETIIHYMFAQWIHSWRDLPYKINQWCNVVRWEMRTRPFLRTTEFLWQEAHTAHETETEALDEVMTMITQYSDLIENYLAIPCIKGIKPQHEKFAGAEKTFTIEALMQDGKALQMCTSHLIAQTFAHAFNMKFQDRDGKEAYPYLTSSGFTTRSIGALIMVHGDQKGLVIPPKVAPIQVIVIPIFNAQNKDVVLFHAQEMVNALAQKVRVQIDADDQETPGAKFYKWELKGVPLRIEIGMRDIEKKSVIVSDRLGLSKAAHPIDHIVQIVEEKIEHIHNALFEKAHQYLKAQWHHKAKFTDFAEQLEKKGGIYQTGWCQRAQCAEVIKEHKATIRCLLNEHNFASCCICQQESPFDILIAKAY
ncbi:MAG: proline--tRNA ligase [Candidatus Babeliaceae bacterium]